MPPRRRKLRLFENTKELHLRCGRHLRYFVEKERTAVGELEQSSTSTFGAGERTSLVTEDLAFEQRLRNRGAVHRDELAVFVRGQIMERARYHFFTRARLTDDEHRRPRRCDLAHERVELFHRRAHPHDAPEASAFGELSPIARDLLKSSRPLERAFEDLTELSGVDGLGQVVERALFHRLHGGRDTPFGSQHDDREVIELGRETGEQAEPIHARHHEIRDHDLGAKRVGFRQTFNAVGCGLGLVTPAAHELGQPPPRPGFIVDDQDACHFSVQHSASSIQTQPAELRPAPVDWSPLVE